MDSVFIVRPFGKARPVVKKNKDGVPEIVFFDFDNVEKVLMQPAIEKAGLGGGTTLDIFESGEIKEDMFSRLLMADIVIADISIHNANVFYELGIRHALRCKTTVIIKAKGFDETPFDILGYRYIDYEKDDPAAALDSLVEFLKDSPASVKKDSPVFNMLPKLIEQETERFLAVPPDFSDEVTIAAASKQIGNLLLLSSEAEFFPWMLPALRMIGEAFFKLRALDAGRIVWEKIKGEKPADIQAADRLATIYQRLSDKELKTNVAEGLTLLAKSDLAIQALLDNYETLDADTRAEAYALKGRNAKTKWETAWVASGDDKRRSDALQSIFLDAAFKSYENGFLENLNHFYSGINALGLLTVKTALAEGLPEKWNLSFDTDEDGAKELADLKTKRTKLAAALELALESEKRRLGKENKTDIWVDITGADFKCLTSSRPQKVAAAYSQVLAGAPDFAVEAVTNQLKIYEQLAVLPENVQASLAAIRPVQESASEIKKHYLLFTGHMIDKAGRKEPRFPPEKEAAARQKIKEKVAEEQAKLNTDIAGISGGACGGDILFHEVCAELGIPTELYLVLPADSFKVESVNFAGPDWTERFNALYKKIPHHSLCDKKDLPPWLQKKKDYTIWERNNLWLLNSALINGGMYMTLIALWDGKGGDGPGGTQHMVREAEARGAKTIIIDVATL